MFAVRSELCIGCGICAKVCPTNAISIRAGKSQINQSACIECGQCAQECPRGAIKEYIPFQTFSFPKRKSLIKKKRTGIFPLSPTVGVPHSPFVRWTRKAKAQPGARTSLWELRASLLRVQRDLQTLNARLNRLENTLEQG